MEAFLNLEKRELGVETSGLESSFFALHDSWRGIPRIWICEDGIKVLPDNVRKGCLHHEAAHTVLHGSLEYYIFTLPRELLELVSKGKISMQNATSLLYIASVTVKDYEVTRYLYRNGFVKDQVAYVKYLLKHSQSDAELWETAKKNRISRLLFLTSILKNIYCATPLLEDEEYGKEVENSIVESVNYLSQTLIGKILRMTKVASKFSDDTRENLNLLIREVIKEFT